jgi:phosphoribosylanthranilate isomerase
LFTKRGAANQIIGSADYGNAPGTSSGYSMRDICDRIWVMARIKIKICGITQREDALVALEAGADFIGLNLFAGPRKITVLQAAEILAGVGDAGAAVALVDLSTADGFAAANQLAQEYGVRTFQLYGDLVSARSLPGADVQYWPVFRIAVRDDLRTLTEQVRRLPFSATAILVDAFSAQGYGGTGTRIDGSALAEARRGGELRDLPPLVFAGGLHSENIGSAIEIVQPWAVDVSSGVEYAGRPGIKDHAKVRAFIKAVRL